eukprot:CAMPEP_0172307102 /NCGR_PEP_ID=MMETSP1058-20130122/8022_1 /TAXON_ID=83371 /ORGANISM="Detonula confervacea, Strain CCMP 353" /LENGTH=992 /DNA_ID=CAMNT_0013019177 /DNA_START=105 /DNA_END=3083 /DNA_ORIENTATION=-
MNSQSQSASRSKNNQSVLNISSLVVLVTITTAPQDVVSFSTPSRSFLPPRIIHDISSRTPAASSFQRAATAATTTTTTQLNAHLAYLNSLNAITSNPHLFPTTSDYIHTLSQLEKDYDASSGTSVAAPIPSAEEFLTQLSTELLRASREQEEVMFQPTTTSSAAVAAVESDSPFLYNLAESILPAATSAVGVGAAAASYNPASYSHLTSQMNIMASFPDYGSIINGVDNGHATDFTAAVSDAAAATEHAAAVPDASNALYADYTASTTATAGDALINNNNEAATSSAGESFAGWHSQVQGGSNSLRDLASAIPNVEQQDVGYHPVTAVSGMHDYFGNDAGYYYLAENGDAGHQVGHVMQDAMHDSVVAAASSSGAGFDASTVSNAYASSSFQLGDTTSTSSVSSALGNLAAAIPTDADMNIAEQQDVRLTDNLLGGMNNMMEQFSNGEYIFPTETGEAGQQQQQVVPMVQETIQDVVSAASDSSASSVVAAMDTAPIEGAAAVAMDTASMEGAAMDQASFIPEVNNALTDSLSSQLSDLNYDGLRNIDSGTTAEATKAFTSTNVPPLSDSIKSNLDQKLDLFPQYHLELPKALSTSPLTKPNLGSLSDSIKSNLDQKMELFPQYHLELPKVLNKAADLGASSVRGWSHLFHGLGDKVADASNSFESFSGQASKVADSGVSGVKAIGNAVQSGASTVGEGLTGMESNIKGVGEGMAGIVSSVKSVGAGLHLPNLNVQPPTLPEMKMNLPAPSLPNVNFEAPSLPHVNLPQPNLPNVNIQAPALPNLNIVEGTNAAVNRVGDASLTDFGNGIISAIKFTGGIIIKFLDLILNAIAGTSVASILTNVQSSITSVIDNASHTVVSTITNIGNMSIKEILQHLMALVIAITDILLKIMNAIVYLISGKDGADWALQATSTVNEASSHLLAQATSTYDHVTHDSLTQLAHSVGDYSQYVGNEVVTLIGSLNGGLVDGMSIPEDTMDSVMTAVQTALSL